MELLNVAFVILLVKIALGVVPLFTGITFLLLSEESKRELRNKICSQLFGVQKAIPFPNFNRALLIISVVLILLGGLISWFLVLKPFLDKLQ